MLILLNKISDFLNKREFVSVASCNLEGCPNAAPKFILKVENGFIYLVDYTIGSTYRNLKINPRVSISLVDADSLAGYQVNGEAQILESPQVYEDIMRDLQHRKIDLSARRIAEGVSRGRKHQNFEVSISDKIVIFKIKINEVVEIGPRGEIIREQVC